MAMPESHEERCRQLAELTLRPVDFASLRGEHEWREKASGGEEGLVVCRRCKTIHPNSQNTTNPTVAPYCPRTDLESLMISAAAYGKYFFVFWHDDEWVATEALFLGQDWPLEFASHGPCGASPREALSAALWQAIFTEVPA